MDKQELPALWFVGSMNDGCFIIDKPPRPSHDYPNHDADVRCITGFPANCNATFKAAQAICEAHNAALTAQSTEVARLTQCLQEATEYADEYQAQNARLTAEVEGLRKTAERYQALRHAGSGIQLWEPEHEGWHYKPRPADVDAWCDAAMKEKTNG